MHHNHDHDHANQHSHHLHHSGHRNEPKNCGSDMCLVENREVENFSGIDQAITVNHVWESCRPGGSFTSSVPTVSAGKVRLTRVHLQSTPKCTYDTEDPQPCPTVQSSQPDCPRQNRSLLETVKNLAASLIYPVNQQRNEGAGGGAIEDNDCENDGENEIEEENF